MNKMRLALIVALLMALMIPMTVQAAGVFYCSTLRASGGTGTYADPWACGTQAQIDTVVYSYICNAGGGWLYQIYANEYVYYRIEWVGKQCQITWQQRYPGYPPNTGVDIPMPLLVGGALTLGAVMVVGGVALRRRKTA